MEYFTITNLEKYQHYSDRPNIWIKWYQKSLSDYKFGQLRDSERWLFVGIIMIAVETNNNIPKDAKWLYKRLCYGCRRGSNRVAIGLQKMIDLGLIQVKNAIIEVERKKDTIKNKNSNSFLTTDKQKFTEQEWIKILRSYKSSGGRVIDNKRLIIKKDNSRWLVDRLGTWDPYTNKFNKQ